LNIPKAVVKLYGVQRFHGNAALPLAWVELGRVALPFQTEWLFAVDQH